MDFQFKLDTGIKHIHLLLPPTCHFYVLKHFQFYNTKDIYFPTDQKIALTLPWLIE